MPGRRVERLNEQFRRELTEILRGEAKDPRVAGVTLTAVHVASDLSFARVFVAPMLEQEASDEALNGLRNASPFLRKELGARLHVRRVPELRFEIDDTLAHARRIEQLLEEVAAAGSREDAGSASSQPGAEPGPGGPAAAGTAGPDPSTPDDEP